MNNIIGTYKVIKYGYLYKKDQRFEPISDWFSGVINYSANGQMSVVMRFSSSPTEMKDIVAYTGSYQVEGDLICHQVEMSARPEYEKQVLNRRFRFVGSDLELEFEDTEEFRKFAVWKRI